MKSMRMLLVVSILVIGVEDPAQGLCHEDIVASSKLYAQVPLLLTKQKMIAGESFK